MDSEEPLAIIVAQGVGTWRPDVSLSGHLQHVFARIYPMGNHAVAQEIGLQETKSDSPESDSYGPFGAFLVLQFVALQRLDNSLLLSFLLLNVLLLSISYKAPDRLGSR